MVMILVQATIGNDLDGSVCPLNDFVSNKLNVIQLRFYTFSKFDHQRSLLQRTEGVSNKCSTFQLFNTACLFYQDL